MEIIHPKNMRKGIVPGPKIVTLVSCGTKENPNIITVSYTGQITDKLIYISLRPSRYSNELIKTNKLFTINYIGADLVKEADFCGMHSGRDVDKFKKTGLTLDITQTTPMISEAPLSLECSLTDISRIGEHDVFFGEILKSVRRRDESDWLYHDNLIYFSKNGDLGRLFEEGK